MIRSPLYYSLYFFVSSCVCIIGFVCIIFLLISCRFMRDWRSYNVSVVFFFLLSGLYNQTKSLLKNEFESADANEVEWSGWMPRS
jgi:hypothetical protein